MSRPRRTLKVLKARVQGNLINAPRVHPVYCFCRSSQGGFMIWCEMCFDWFHGDCVGITEEQSKYIEHYLCPCCARKKPLCKNGKKEKEEQALQRKKKKPKILNMETEETAINRLNDDCLLSIFRACEGCLRTLLRIRMVCQRWRQLSKEASLWYHLTLNLSTYPFFSLYLTNNTFFSNLITTIRSLHLIQTGTVPSLPQLNLLSSLTRLYLTQAYIDQAMVLASTLPKLTTLWCEHVRRPLVSWSGRPGLVDINVLLELNCLEQLCVRSEEGGLMFGDRSRHRKTRDPDQNIFFSPLIHTLTLVGFDADDDDLHNYASEWHFLAYLTNLSRLTVGRCEWWTAELWGFLAAGCETLEELSLTGFDVTAEEKCGSDVWACVGRMKRLRKLEIREWWVGPGLIEAIALLDIQELRISNRPIPEPVFIVTDDREMTEIYDEMKRYVGDVIALVKAAWRDGKGELRELIWEFGIPYQIDLEKKLDWLGVMIRGECALEKELSITFGFL